MQSGAQQACDGSELGAVAAREAVKAQGMFYKGPSYSTCQVSQDQNRASRSSTPTFKQSLTFPWLLNHENSLD